MIPTVNGANATQQTGATSSPPSTTSDPVDALANESTFLQLLVAQLKNQDPESPQDGTQFVAQLAQFSSLEQQLEMRQDLDAIKTDVTNVTSAANTGTGTSGVSATGNSSNATINVPQV